MTLFIDTSFHHLSLALLDEAGVIASFHQEANKRQSERLLPEVQALFVAAKRQPSDLKSLLICDGPGSYTGLRIAMTFAKTLATLENLTVYSLSSLHVLAGLNDCVVVMDARADRVYLGQYAHGTALKPDAVVGVEEARLMHHSAVVVGQGSLIGHNDVFEDPALNAFNLRPHWRKVTDLDRLAPRYLKDVTP
jgi:tRNA threonylcarbamoyladenosine biosynthesis protein TsaB